ncbi:MAG: hypothetical protein ACOYME_06930 [Prochlorotrichaceae cyanobacterium]
MTQVQTEYKIRYEEDNFIVIQKHHLSPLFREEFEFNQQNLDVFSSEAARCEIIIFPILREIYKGYCQTTSLWVQKSIAYDEKLNGTPDYVISKKSELGKTILEFPLIIIAEAKKNDFEQGWAQCLSELIASRDLNQQPERPVYGIVTDGKLWEFGKLYATLFTKNTDSFTVSDLDKVFGALKFIFEEATKLIGTSVN